MTMLGRIASVIRNHQLIHAYDKVLVAVSGGSDSLALLHILHEIDLPQKLTVVYIDHGLRPHETPKEQKTVRENCLALKIPFTVRKVNVSKMAAEDKISQEEAARILRYQALEEVRQESGARLIAVGHTADDQVEEFFIRLLRGSSCRGLSGMRVKRDKIIRPLLFESKAALAAFLTNRGIEWCLDSTNLHRRYLRNRIRLDLLPYLEKEFNPAFRKTLLHSMDLLAREDQFLGEHTEKAYRQCTEATEIPLRGEKRMHLYIDREKILASHPAIRRRIIEKSCWQIGIRPTYELICTLVDFIDSGKIGTELHLEDGVRAEKSLGGLHLLRPLPKGLLRGSKPPASFPSQTIPGPGTYPMAGSDRQLILEEIAVHDHHESAEGELLLDRAKISFPLQLRSARPGERFHPYGGPGSKKIARYFNERKIPAKDRPAWPVLLSGGRIIALVGLQLDHSFRLLPDSAVALSVRWHDRRK